MTDEELGRKWAKANGHKPYQHDTEWRWAALWVQPNPFPPPIGHVAKYGYNDEWQAYFALGQAIRAAWEFADESRKQVGE